VAAVGAVIYGNANLIAVLVATGVGVPALLVIVLATWTSNDKNLYESALALSTLLPRWQRWQLTAVAGAIGTALATAGIFEHFVELLIFLGIVIAPVAGVYLSDFHFERQRYAPDATSIDTLRWPAFAAWAGGILTGLLTLPRASHGFGFLQLTCIPALDAILAAAIAYIVLRKTLSAAERSVSPAQ
jgi:cytosine permease